MTQYAYGKNVIKTLISQNIKIHEIIVADNMKDEKFLSTLKQHRIPLKTMGRNEIFIPIMRSIIQIYSYI